MKQGLDLAEKGMVIDIPGEYNLKLPFDTIDEVINFGKFLETNNLQGIDGKERNRRMELVSI